MAGIFISYRRDETAAYAGRLRDHLVEAFSPQHVFMDVDTIELGADFTQAIDQAIANVTVLLCVMGPEWASLKNGDGLQRLSAPMDFVTLEVASALKRNIRVIPLLVKDAEMPSADELPPELRDLTKRNALHLSDTRFHADIDFLIKGLQKTITIPRSDITSTGDGGRSITAKTYIGIAIGLLLGLVAAGSWYYWTDIKEQLQIAQVTQTQSEQELKKLQQAEAERLKREQELNAQQQTEAEQAQRQAQIAAQQRADKEQALRNAALKSHQAAELKAQQEAAALQAQQQTEAEQDRRDTELKAQQQAEAEQAKKAAELKAQQEAELAQREARRAQLIYRKITGLYQEAKTTNDCTRVKAIVKSIDTMTRYSYKIPGKQNTTAELAKDLSAKIRTAKTSCFRRVFQPELVINPQIIEQIR